MTTGTATAPRTLFEKIWERHKIVERDDGETLLYIDRHLIHDGSRHAFELLAERGLKLRRPERTFGTPDHYVPTANRDVASIADPEARGMVESITRNAAKHKVTLFDLGDPRQGIVHVVGPEQGLTQPGLTLVCGDSHTSTHGALGALAFGIGASEVGHVLATQSLWQQKPKTLRIAVEGRLGVGVFAKDIILAIIAKIGAAGAVGHAIEYAGSAIRSLGMEGRLTVCNMSIEAGGRAGMIAPDDTTFAYVAGRPFAPKGKEWDKALAYWRTLPSDSEARFDREVTLHAGDIAPMVTWGTSPEHAAPISGRVPDPAQAPDAETRAGWSQALAYMGLEPGTPLEQVAIDRVFIGSCTNSRIEDLRAAAKVVAGKKAVVPAWAVPGSGLVKAEAEAEGLDRVFKAAGFEWRVAGCSMCVGMNGDLVKAGERCASTSNRNFAGRQGKGARTHLVSPAMAAAAALSGRLSDVRKLLAGGS
ncbi:MAG TPA: 3-isopropylmalate dehydratase large subunit [Alphaproteobacteria bacterium]|nr:3-isopropylmalate dehydratase large subunit [Alphaproteobacteria bacterium]